MAHGEALLTYDAAHTGWYYFDRYTGAMAHGVTLVPATKTSPAKWVYYDIVTGKMAHGEACLTYDEEHTGWYYFDPVTGAMDHEWAWLPAKGKWVYYDKFTGKMRYGSLMIDGKPYFLDPVTGEKLSRAALVQRVLAIARSRDGIESPDDYINALSCAGGSVDPYGPCMTYIWWCFQQAGMRYQLLDGWATGWPHDAANWFAQRGRLKRGDPEPGDIWLVNQPGWGPEGASATHAGIVDHVANGRVYVWQHVDGKVKLVAENPSFIRNGYVAGYGHPDLNGD